MRRSIRLKRHATMRGHQRSNSPKLVTQLKVFWLGGKESRGEFSQTSMGSDVSRLVRHAAVERVRRLVFDTSAHSHFPRGHGNVLILTRRRFLDNILIAAANIDCGGTLLTFFASAV